MRLRRSFLVAITVAVISLGGHPGGAFGQTALSAASAVTLPAAGQDSLASRLQTNAQVYFADGQLVETWHPLTATLSRVSVDHIYTMDTLCVFATPNVPPSATGYGWNLNVTPVGEVGGSLSVRAEWQRVKDRGAAVDAPRSAVELTLRPGQWVPLDYIQAGPVPAGRSCNATGMLLRIGIPATK